VYELTMARLPDLDAIADRVMSSGLGIHKPSGSSSPRQSHFGTEAPIRGREVEPSQKCPGTRPNSSGSELGTTESFSEKLERQRATQAANQSASSARSPLLSSRDIHIVFANIDEVANLAEIFSGLLHAAKGTDEENDTNDRIGEVFREMASLG
jgi:hypothetical protein